MMFQRLKACDGEGKRVGRGEVPKKPILSEFQPVVSLCSAAPCRSHEWESSLFRPVRLISASLTRPYGRR